MGKAWKMGKGRQSTQSVRPFTVKGGVFAHNDRGGRRNKNEVRRGIEAEQRGVPRTKLEGGGIKLRCLPGCAVDQEQKKGAGQRRERVVHRIFVYGVTGSFKRGGTP